MTDAELLIECKKGLGPQVEGTDFNDVLTQKLLAVKSFMLGAGVSETSMLDDLAVGIIVMGVADLWNVEDGEIKFSPVFYSLLSQLAIGSSVLKVTSSPAEGATAVSVNVKPVLTFNSRIKSYSIALVSYSTQVPVTIVATLDITGKLLTIETSNPLDAATKYAIVIDRAAAYAGQTMKYTVISFTTA